MVKTFYNIIHLTVFLIFDYSLYGYISSAADPTTTASAAEYGARFLPGSGGDDFGVVQVYQSGSWKTLCRDGFDDAEATVVCRQMGFAGGRLWKKSAGSGGIDTMIYRCAGSESDLSGCVRFSGPSDRNCSHNEDISVNCYKAHQDPDIAWPEGSARVVGGSAHDETPAGTLEVLQQGAWRPVCPDGWNDAGACAACRQMGFRGSGCKAEAYFGLSSGYDSLSPTPTILAIGCSMADDNLYSCSQSKVFCSNHVGHDRVDFAGIRCAEPADLDFRLVNEGHTYDLHYGTIEVYVANTRYWHPVCDAQAQNPSWYNQTANQVCRELGHKGGHAVLGSKYGRSRAQGEFYAPIKNLEAGTVQYGNCETSKHLGAYCDVDLPDNIKVSVKGSTTVDPYYSKKYRLDEERKTPTVNLVMYLGISGACLGLAILGCLVIKKLKYFKRRRETGAAAVVQPPVGSAKLGPVPGMVIIPARGRPNAGPGAPPRSHIITHTNQAYNPAVGDPANPVRPNDDDYFQRPQTAASPPVFHGAAGYQWPGQITPVDSDQALAAAGAMYCPPPYDSLYPAQKSPEPPPPAFSLLPPIAPSASEGYNVGNDACPSSIRQESDPSQTNHAPTLGEELDELFGQIEGESNSPASPQGTPAARPLDIEVDRHAAPPNDAADLYTSGSFPGVKGQPSTTIQSQAIPNTSDIPPEPPASGIPSDTTSTQQPPDKLFQSQLGVDEPKAELEDLFESGDEESALDHKPPEAEQPKSGGSIFPPI